MNRCTECGGNVVAGPQQVEHRIGERLFVGPVAGWSCPTCGEVYYAAADLEANESAIASWLAHHGISSTAELKFMRKVAGIKAVDLAALFGVTPETVSHWETGKHAPDRVTRATIASLVLDALRGESATRGLLKAQEEPSKAKTVRLGPAAA
jgi:putative zinc finger/helix-turn-helix YgiT family protein